MNPRTQFTAPWGRNVKIVTAATVLLSCGIVLVVGWSSRSASGGDLGAAVAVACALVVILGGSTLFSIRGYRLSKAQLYVLRPGWETTVSLTRLQRAEVDPKALAGILLKAGSAGFCGYFGWFWSFSGGFFRAWVTDPARSVRLTFSDRVVVVSPDDPGAFMDALRHQRGERVDLDLRNS